MDELVCLLTGLTILGGLIGFAIYGLIVFIKTSFGSSQRAAAQRAQIP